MNADERNDHIHYTAFLKAKAEGMLSGDAFKVRLMDGEYEAVLIDGLGSGAGANASATVVINEFEDNPSIKPEQLLEKSNGKLIGMRGAVAAAICIHFESRLIEYSSIGNISCYIFKRKTKRIIYPRQQMGYLSGEKQFFSTQAIEYESGDYFLLHTDGVSVNDLKVLFDEEEFMRVQYMQSDSIQFHNDDASFIAGRLF